ncbi:putative MFS family arabinose efflux permease [Advenella incenata]|jgi:MFS family permease|uniref:Putative MFS family arabinose efflux permease n=1 Tax=Advenella incenata TaxID=267800 RepID=A0A4Q7VTY8_9BURK|nr:MFS transporter [Advenella incenata]RZU00074.1 putative MFS family arabinose efflux permease [Advenella incenata]
MTNPSSHDTAKDGAAADDATHIMLQRRFAPYFWTQISGAANDNLFKFAVTIMLTYHVSVSWLPPEMAGVVINGMFIIPFLLLSAVSGQMSDKFEKARFMRWIKTAEIGIMGLAAFALIYQQVYILLLCVLLMGIHSTVFGPVKFAYLPQVFHGTTLVSSNGWVEMGTFVAILLGNMAGGFMAGIEGFGYHYVAACCVLIAVAGRLCSGLVPPTPVSSADLKLNWNPIGGTIENLKYAFHDRHVFKSILLISWMWFFGAVYLNIFPVFAKEILRGDEQVATLLLGVFSIGVGFGSVLCGWIGKKGLNVLKLVPVGAAGMTIFSVALYFLAHDLNATHLLALHEFVRLPANWLLITGLFLLSMSAGLYSVPLYVLIQQKTPKTHSSRVIAANNIMNAIFLVASSVITGLLIAFSTVPLIVLFLGIANAIFVFVVMRSDHSYITEMREPME